MSPAFVKGGGSQRTNYYWTELTCNKLTQFYDALLVTRVSVAKLIGYSSQTAVQFSSSVRSEPLLKFEKYVHAISSDMSTRFLLSVRSPVKQIFSHWCEF